MPPRYRRLPGRPAAKGSPVRKLECGCLYVLNRWCTPVYTRCPKHKEKTEEDFNLWWALPLWARVMYAMAALGGVAVVGLIIFKLITRG